MKLTQDRKKGGSFAGKVFSCLLISRNLSIYVSTIQVDEMIEAPIRVPPEHSQTVRWI